jgi:serine phosphatase RsbU (regulator of sigma subunit)/DNA-binding NarL/FixJ family response regulator
MDSAPPIRVMIVDDHDMVRRGLSVFLRAKPDLDLVGEAGDGQEALRLCEQVRPDVVLMDLVMPRMDGASATRALRERCPQVQVIALTSFTDKGLVQEALEAGAIGYLLKTVSTDELAEAIRAAYAGRPTLAREAVQILAQAARLEELQREILSTPPDLSGLPALLERHVPLLLPQCSIEVCRFPDQTLLRHPAEAPTVAESAWQWARSLSRPRSFGAGAALPWDGQVKAAETHLLVPILEQEAGESSGCLYVLCAPDPEGTAYLLLPAVQGLAVQLAAAFGRAATRAQRQAHERVVQELALAGQIQASFLPESVPELPGWQVAARFLPARETSGDFYDFIPLPNGRLGFLVADVADKGMGAALYMALSRTLIRAYAEEHAERPDLLLSTTSQHILADTRSDLFVSAFYGILDPGSGQMDYCNAGHNPPYLLRAGASAHTEELRPTGMLLGVVPEATWNMATAQLGPGDLLLLYTDGLTDAQNARGDFFGTERVLEVAEAHRGQQAGELLQGLLSAVAKFVGQAQQFDDLTLVTLARRDLGR